MAATPYRFEQTHPLGAVRDQWGAIADGEETGVEVKVGGRLMLRREQGKLAFGVLRDWTGQVQLFAGKAWTEDLEGFSKVPLGTWIGVAGQVVKTRTGELSVKVLSWEVLAEARRSFGDKWRGVTDPDLRYRQRYVDLWANEGSRERFLQRSRILSLTRRFLEDRGFVEVETPTFHPILGGAAAKPFTTHHNALDLELYLRIAPELYLKRLVVGGFERVFEVARVFRNEGLSPRHNPEFTMLEAYMAYADYKDLMVLIEELVEHLAIEIRGTTVFEYPDRDGTQRELDLTAPWRRASMTDLIEEHAGVRVDVRMPIEDLRAVCDEHGVRWKGDDGPGKLVLELYEKTTEADLWGPVHVTDYPQEVSPLSRAHRELHGYVERFESIVAGRELLNAFSELVDPDEQRARFEDQVAKAAAGDDEAMAVVDDDYVRALEHGLPPTAGLGIGMDRLAMILTGAETIRDIVLFPTMRPLPSAQVATDDTMAVPPTSEGEGP